MESNLDPIELRLKALAVRGHLPKEDREACPSDELFGAFMDGLLSEEKKEELKTHIARCPHCHLAYTVWQDTARIEGAPVPAHLIESARSLVKPPLTRVALKVLKKAFEILNPKEIEIILPLQPSPATLRRGEKSPRPDQYEITDIKPKWPHIESLRIQHLEETGTLKLSLYPFPDLSSETRRRLRIELYQEQSLFQSWPIYDKGTSLNPIEKGSYRLCLVEAKAPSEKRGFRTLGSMDLDLK